VRRPAPRATWRPWARRTDMSCHPHRMTTLRSIIGTCRAVRRSREACTSKRSAKRTREGGKSGCAESDAPYSKSHSTWPLPGGGTRPLCRRNRLSRPEQAPAPPVSTRVAEDASKGSHSSRCCQVGPKVGPSVTEGKQGEKSRGHHGVGGGFAGARCGADTRAASRVGNVRGAAAGEGARST